MINKFSDFIFLDETKILGSGSFSKVYLVSNRKNNTIYAMKEVISSDRFGKNDKYILDCIIKDNL